MSLNFMLVLVLSMGSESQVSAADESLESGAGLAAIVLKINSFKASNVTFPSLGYSPATSPLLYNLKRGDSLKDSLLHNSCSTVQSTWDRWKSGLSLASWYQTRSISAHEEQFCGANLTKLPRSERIFDLTLTSSRLR